MPPIHTDDELEHVPYWQTTDETTIKLYLGDVLDNLRQMRSRSVQCVITSPPYFGLRDYGTGQWDGGSKECDHTIPDRGRYASSTLNAKRNADGTLADDRGSQHCKQTYPNLCKKCGAKRIDQQLGSEKTPQEFVAKMVEVFREVRRVLRDDGTLWLNLGDSYNANIGGRVRKEFDSNKGGTPGYVPNAWGGKTSTQIVNSGLKPGNLLGMPWRVALALQDDGWILRSDIPWVKRSSMPESVQNRPAKSLEYVFLLTKQMNYYFDMEAIRQELKADPEEYRRMLQSKQRQNSSQLGTSKEAGAGRKTGGFNSFISDGKTEVYVPSGRAFRQTDLWFQSIKEPHGMVGIEDELVGLDVNPAGYPGAHFATYPCKLIEPMILAGTSAKGSCTQCRRPWRRVVKVEQPNKVVSEENRGDRDRSVNRNRNGITGSLDGEPAKAKTVGWEPGCHCDCNETIPQIILDPFMGSGTTAEVALMHGRHCVGIELSQTYLDKNCIPRIEGYLNSIPALSHLVYKTAQKPLSFKGKGKMKTP